MKVHISEYTPIRTLLSIAVTQYNQYHDVYLKIMVRDAICLSRDSGYRIQANRRMFRYSSYLSKHFIPQVSRMNPEHLTLDDYRLLLDIFSRL